MAGIFLCPLLAHWTPIEKLCLMTLEVLSPGFIRHLDLRKVDGTLACWSQQSGPRPKAASF